MKLLWVVGWGNIISAIVVGGGVGLLVKSLSLSLSLLLPPSPKSPYQPQAGLIGIWYIYTHIGV